MSDNDSNNSLQALDEIATRSPTKKPTSPAGTTSNNRTTKRSSVSAPSADPMPSVTSSEIMPRQTSTSAGPQQTPPSIPMTGVFGANPAAKRSHHGRTVSGGLQHNIGTLPPPASLSRAPRIILEEKERRERAAQEILTGMLGTESSNNNINENPSMMMMTSDQQHSNNNNNNHPDNNSFQNPDFQNNNNNVPFNQKIHHRHSSHAHDVHNFDNNSNANNQQGTSTSNLSRQLTVEMHQTEQGVATMAGEKAKKRLGLLSQSLHALDEAGGAEIPQAEGLTRANTTGQSSQNNIGHISGELNSPHTRNTRASGDLRFGSNNNNPHIRAQSNIEYLVKTEHGAAHNKASVKFNAQQESMALASVLGGGHHHHHVHGRTTSQGARRHSNTMSGGANYSGLPSPSAAAAAATGTNVSNSSPVFASTQRPSSTSPQNSEFTAEQLAAIAAFSGLPADQNVALDPTQQQQQQQHARHVSSKFYTKHHHHQQSSSHSRKQTTTQQQQQAMPESPEANGNLSESRSGNYTTPQQNSQEENGNDEQRPNPLLGIAQGGEGGKKKKKCQIQSPTEAEKQQNNKTGLANGDTDNQSDHSSENPDIVYAGFGPRDTIEVPKIPYDSAWKQNTLPSIRFSADALSTILMLLFVSITTLPLGALLFAETFESKRIDVRYENIAKYRHPIAFNSSSASSSSDSSSSASGFLWNQTIDNVLHRQGVKTLIRFNITETLTPPIIMSYGLTEFFQNHLNVQQSKSHVQNAGAEIVSELDVANCAPLLRPGELKGTDEQKAASGRTVVDDLSTNNPSWKLYRDFMYHPCGSLAWSMFNDSFAVFKVPVADEVQDPNSYNWSTAFSSSTNPDDYSKYRFYSYDSRYNFTDNSSFGSGVKLFCNSSDFSFSGDRLTLTATQNPCEKAVIQRASDASRFQKPNVKNNGGLLWMNTIHGKYNTSNVYLANGWYIDEPGHSLPSVFDLDLQIWMRIAPLSSFRKVLRVINEEMPAGQYQLEINEYWDSNSFGGEKFVSFESRRSLVSNGGRSFGMAVVYCATGGFAAVIMIGVAVDWFITGER